MANRAYRYVGPASLAVDADHSVTGVAVATANELQEYIARSGTAGPFTFVVSTDGDLVLASRNSEHVQCARGGRVLSAGEVTFAEDGSTVDLVSNQSTGYCPEPESWPAVADALRPVVGSVPEGFTSEFLFRRCESCDAINVVKDDWFVCAECDVDLPKPWNL